MDQVTEAPVHLAAGSRRRRLAGGSMARRVARLNNRRDR
jgi:hypothetical protein